MKTGINNNGRNNSEKSKEQQQIAESKAKRDKLDKKGYYVKVPDYLPITKIFVKCGEDKNEVFQRFKEK